MTQTHIEPAIISEIAIHAPASKVFSALTEPAQLTQWWGSGEEYRVEHMEADLHVGGRWRSSGTSANGEPFSVEGIYRVIEPPHVLEYTWNYDWDDNARETVVRFDLTEANGVTNVRVTHSGFTNAQARASHDAGWRRVLGWLQRYVE